MESKEALKWEIETPSVKEVLLNPSLYVGKEIILVGMLVNEGNHYFINPKFVLKDEEGNVLDTNAWVPLEVPPLKPGSSLERPMVMSDYLNKKLRLRGELISEPRDLKVYYYFKVRSAEFIKGVKEGL